MGKELIIAIDGPSGAGKSTLSKRVARALGYINIDTGAMYRCVALAAARSGIEPQATARLAELSRSISVAFSMQDGIERVLLDGEDVSDAIRTSETSRLTPQVAAVPEVRGAMVDLQRQMGRAGGVVLEGRDIGSVVFPEAEVKIFLVATAAERGRRRYEELVVKGESIDLDKTIAEIEERDQLDSSRAHSPLVRHPDAVEIDTTGLSIDQVESRILQVVAERKNRAGEGG